MAGVSDQRWAEIRREQEERDLAQHARAAVLLETTAEDHVHHAAMLLAGTSTGADRTNALLAALVHLGLAATPPPADDGRRHT